MFPTGRELEGRVALVTGSARNIGRAIAVALGEAGASVVVNARSSQVDAEATVRMIEAAGSRALLAIADVTDPNAVQRMIAECEGHFGRLDILVNNAAIRSDHPIEEISFEEWRRVTASILDGSFLCAQAALPHLRRSDAAAIISIGGVAGHVGVSHRAHVATAKAGIAGLTRALAAELASERITVNCVSPGQMETQRNGPMPEHFRQRPVPLGRGGHPEELAGWVRMLAGPLGRFITGQVIHFNGGWHMAQ